MSENFTLPNPPRRNADTLTVTNPDNFDNNWAEYGVYTFSGFTVQLDSITIASNQGFSGDILNPKIVNNTIEFDWPGVSSALNGSSVLVFDINSTSTTTAAAPDGALTLGLLGSACLALACWPRKRTLA